MKIKLTTLMCGPDGNAQPGDVIHVEPGRGRALVAGNFAVEIIESSMPAGPAEPQPETAVIAPPEPAIGAPRRGRHGR